MKLKAEHFDWLGVLCFPFIFAYGVYVLKTGTLPPSFVTNLLVIIGIGGFFIDGTIIYKYFLKKKR
jgi:hypothetical protein